MATTRSKHQATSQTRPPAPSIGGWRRLGRVALPYLAPLGVASMASAAGWTSPLTLSAVAIAAGVCASVRIGVEWVRIEQRRERVDSWIIARSGQTPLESDLRERIDELTSERLRLALANTLCAIAVRATSDGRPRFSHVPIALPALRPFERDLLELAEQLRDVQQPVSPRAVALVNRLLRDAGSHLFSANPDPALTRALRDIQLALRP